MISIQFSHNMYNEGRDSDTGFTISINITSSLIDLITVWHVYNVGVIFALYPGDSYEKKDQLFMA